MNILKIYKKDLETIGENSLSGLIFQQFGEIPEKVEVQIEEFSPSQREKNGGPDEIIIPEYVIGALLRNATKLIQMGVQLTITHFHHQQQ